MMAINTKSREFRDFLCPGRDSNLHAETGTSPSSWRVYQFHHLGILVLNETPEMPLIAVPEM